MPRTTTTAPRRGRAPAAGATSTTTTTHQSLTVSAPGVGGDSDEEIIIEHPGSEEFAEDFFGHFANDQRDPEAVNIAFVAEDDVLRMQEALKSEYTTLPPAVNILPPGEYEAHCLAGMIRTLDSQDDLRTAMQGRGLDGNEIFDHVELNLGPLLHAMKSDIQDDFAARVKEALSDDFMHRYLCILCVLWFYNTSAEAYYTDTNLEVKVRRYWHSEHELDQKFYSCITEVLGKKTTARPFVADAQIRAYERALAQGFALNLKHAGHVESISVDDQHEQMQIREGGEFGFVVSVNNMKARPMGSTTDVAMTNGGIIIGAVTHLKGKDGPSAAQLMIDVLIENLDRAGLEIRQSQTVEGETQSGLMVNVDRGYFKLLQLVLEKGFNCRATAQRASQVSRSPHAIPESKLTAEKRVLFGTTLGKNVPRWTVNWVKETFPPRVVDKVSFTPRPLYHMWQCDGNGKHLMMVTSQESDVSKFVMLLTQQALRDTAPSVALPPAPFHEPGVWTVFAYPPQYFAQTSTGICVEVVDQRTSAWFDARVDGTSSTLSCKAFKLHGQRKYWSTLMELDEQESLQILGMPVDLVEVSAIVFKVDGRLQLTQVDFDEKLLIAEQLLAVLRYTHELPEVLAKVTGPSLSTAKIKDLRAALTSLKVKSTNVKTEAELRTLLARALSERSKVVFDSPLDEQMRSKAFASTDAMKEGIKAEGPMMSALPKFLIAVRSQMGRYSSRRLQESRALMAKEASTGRADREVLVCVSTVREVGLLRSVTCPYVMDSPDGECMFIFKEANGAWRSSLMLTRSSPWH